MIVRLDSNHSGYSSSLIDQLYYSNLDKSILLSPRQIREYKTEISRYSHPENSIELYADAELIDNPKDKAAQIVRIFESITDASDIQFLKRYFEIKLK